LETAAWTAAATLVSIPIVLAVIHALHPVDVLSLVAIGVSTLAPVSATVLGSLVGSALIRERNLFAYFRAR
jgi:hypothetical protein